ncbi:hypothetical protein [Streptomyces rubellomurinus]|uniref:Uncharacterized protein n=1 Tax=Streptomyces rubellomurinus (strain ATCC 31215) TaxID=359131 RepID=A0A0F2TFF7_STRR3|nr:hypothetical protein [Streptomyces rubellomurinus]KJS60985.1 hypothetical protein VM95_17680 [Streptomyces rubellomurinus]
MSTAVPSQGPDSRRPVGPVVPARAGIDRAAPRRSRVGLVAQFVLQFVYLWLGPLVGIALLALLVSSGGGAGSGSEGDVIVGPFTTVAFGLSWRRLRVEWNGRPEAWEPFTEGILKKRFARAERKSGWEPGDLPPNGVRRAVASLGLHHYRGLAPTRVEQLAARHGWSVDWAKPRSENDGQLHFFRPMPPPEHLGVPLPHGPVPERGAPWGPMRCRVLLSLLTLVFRPRVRLLELRRSPDAYARHLRGHLARKFRKELARDPRKHYRSGADGRILRRVGVKPCHFRCAGAAAVLRVAAEEGWTLDPAFPADPRRTVHLCRPDDGRRRTG